ncbi:MAG: AAA domain-containing protein [Eubacteriales bacterium]
MIIIKGEIKTSQIKSCNYNPVTKKWDITFQNGKMYSYSYLSVDKTTKSEKLIPSLYRISKNNKEFFRISEIYEFKCNAAIYWHICFGDGSEKSYNKNELTIEESALSGNQTKATWDYMKEIATISEIKDDKTRESLLVKKYAKIDFISKHTALAKYLNPSHGNCNQCVQDYIPIFPFGCNNSQYFAVKRAMENQISVIQGPPGTGKTQTILNIIANILMEGKTVQVVSNNNSAIENVYEKLADPKYNLSFLAAKLGNSTNKKEFLKEQEGYPDFTLWKAKEEHGTLKNEILQQSMQLKTIFDKQEEMSKLRTELTSIDTEREYFNQYVDDLGYKIDGTIFKKKLNARDWMNLWQECQLQTDENRTLGFWFKVKTSLKYKIRNRDFYKQDMFRIITIFQTMYYETRRHEISQKIDKIETYLNNYNQNLLEQMCSASMKLLKDKIAKKYQSHIQRKTFCEEDLWKNPEQVLEEYPIILSTTFSSRNSLNFHVEYDYLIMDEASQVDITTGVLALSCAKNVIIVGDTKQLPHVVPTHVKEWTQKIFEQYKLKEGYKYTYSFLESILEVIPDVPKTLLREHYRCHPKIIDFCNQQFYGGELLIMTKDKGERNVLSVIKTVIGNHERDRYNQRQIDSICKEIIPEYNFVPEKTGIITPYRKQVGELRKQVGGFEIDTVHKFQGREMENIIISTVDDEISEFADDASLINVAVSRAKSKLVLVVTGNEQSKVCNITDLVNYIKYNNFEVQNSKVHSVFDYLYQQYSKERVEYLKNHKRISRYDSENLMYVVIKEILKEDKYLKLAVQCHRSLNTLIRKFQLLNERERTFVLHPATHIDFLIYNKVGKNPVLAIEVDGYQYHKEDTAQASRDIMKNEIMEKVEIPLLRLSTNGSGEKDKIIERLDEIMKL